MGFILYTHTRAPSLWTNNSVQAYNGVLWKLHVGVFVPILCKRVSFWPWNTQLKSSVLIYLNPPTSPIATQHTHTHTHTLFPFFNLPGLMKLNVSCRFISHVVRLYWKTVYQQNLSASVRVMEHVIGLRRPEWDRECMTSWLQ